jgi:hypothetical protein
MGSGEEERIGANGPSGRGESDEEEITTQEPGWQRTPPPVKGANPPYDRLYRRVLATVRTCLDHHPVPSIEAVPQRYIRRLLAEEDHDLIGSETRGRIELDAELAEWFGGGDPKLGEAVLKQVRRKLERREVIPITDDEDMEPARFSAKLTRLVEHGRLVRVSKGKYRLPAVPFAEDAVEASESRRELGRDHAAVGFNLPDDLTQDERKALDRLGDLLELAGTLAAYIAADKGPQGTLEPSGYVPVTPDRSSAVLLAAGVYPRPYLELSAGDDPVFRQGDGEDEYEAVLASALARVDAACRALGGDELALGETLYDEGDKADKLDPMPTYRVEEMEEDAWVVEGEEFELPLTGDDLDYLEED